MSARERQRLLVLSRVRDQGMSIGKAAKVLAISYRQARRVYKRFIEEGDVGLVHKGRGRPSGRSLSPEVKKAVLDLCKDKYKGFGPTLAAEKLAEEESLLLDHETLRRWLIAGGLWQRCRKSPAYRQRRTPRPHFGELIQMDGSPHRWFEDRAEQHCLMNMVDDATGTTLSLMDKEENTEISMRLLWAWIDKYGIPEALYVDHHSIFVINREPTIEEQLDGEVPVTQFGRACQKLGIQIICANSPQAKGRVERNHGVYQDRLVKEFRLKGISTIDGANELLRQGFVDKLNAKFAKTPASPVDRHMSVGKKTNLASVFSLEYPRTINNDYTVRYKGRFFQIVKQTGLPPAKSKLTLQNRLDGTIHLIHQDRELEFVEIANPARPQPVVAEQEPKKSTAHTPPPDHPWRSNKRAKQLIGATP